MRLLYDNNVMTSTYIDCYSASGSYPVANLQDTRLSRTYRTDGKASTEYVHVVNSSPVSYAGILNHNLSTACTIYIEGSDSTWSTGAAFSTTVAHSTGIIIVSMTQSSYAYWRFRFNDTSTGTTYIELGGLYLGTYLQLPGMKPDQTISDETTARVTVSDGGQAYGDDGYDYRSPSINFPYLVSTQRTDIRAMFSAVKNFTPVIALIWENSLTLEEPMYCILDQKTLDWKKTGDMVKPWSLSLKLREVF